MPNRFRRQGVTAGPKPNMLHCGSVVNGGNSAFLFDVPEGRTDGGIGKKYDVESGNQKYEPEAQMESDVSDQKGEPRGKGLHASGRHQIRAVPGQKDNGGRR